MAAFQISNEKQSHELGWNLPEDVEDSLIDICQRFLGYLEANKIKTESPKTSQPELGVPVESGAVVSTLCSEGFRGHSSEPPQCQVHESRQIRSGQTGDGKSEH